MIAAARIADNNIALSRSAKIKISTAELKVTAAIAKKRCSMLRSANIIMTMSKNPSRNIVTFRLPSVFDAMAQKAMTEQRPSEPRSVD